MLGKQMLGALNAQINAELYSSYLYLAMAAWAKDKNYDGFSNWMLIQSEEERIHAHKLFDFIIDRGGRVTLAAIEAPPTEWPSVLEMMKATAKHEAHVTMLINKLIELATKEKDYASMNFLQWYVAEQVEEEVNVDQLVKKLVMLSDAPSGLYILDKELGARRLSPEMAGMRPGA